MAQYYRANALYNYMPQDGSQITLTAGDTLQVFDTDSSGWWDGYNEMTGERGLFPSTYVELVEDQGDYNYYNDPRQGAKGKKQPQFQPQPKYNPQDQFQQMGAVPMGSNMNNYGKQSKNEISIPLIEQKEEKAGGGRGGGREGGGERKKRDEKPSCPTRYGLYANQMARLNGISMFIVGIGCFVTAYEALVVMPNTVTNTAQVFGLLQLGVFIYCTLVGLVVYLFETFTGGTKHSAFPTKAVVYTLLSGPLFITFFTLFNGVLFLISAYFHVVSFRLKEDVPAPKKEEASKGEGGRCCACNYLEERTKAGKLGKDFFTYFFVACNLALFAVGLITVYPMIQPGGALAQFTFMLPYAKGFGYALDFAAAVILFPVSRTFIRLLYNYSTQDQTACSRFLRSVLYLFPLDKALHFHEKTGYLILFLSYGHSFAHLVNAGLRFNQVVAFYGWSPLISGYLLWVCIFFMFPATVSVVKRGQFEIFWYSHQLFWAFFILTLIHGRNTLGPHYYYAFILPGAIYVGERIYREYSAYQSVSVISITNMKNNVLSIEFSKSAFPNGYLEGQYCYIQCPKISRGQWHPFTISSAPGDPTVTLHIKIQGKDSWTRQLLEYFTPLGPKNASYFEMADSGPNGVQLGKVIGPTGERMLMVYGPHSAPTQHAPEYTCDIIVGSGIGVTPVSATMQQTVFYRWKYNIGDSNPDHAYFAWVCSYNEIETFRWMIRTVKECQDEVFDLRLKNPDSMGVKTYEVHIWVTSIPDDVKPPGNIEVDDDIGYWGRPRKPTGGVAKAPEQYSELDIYKTMLYPPKGAPAQLGDIRIYNGRPKWDVLFASVAERHLACKIGVAFCGNPRIGEDLKEMCTKYTNPQANQSFTLHKENF